jgi:hypothetical protein
MAKRVLTALAVVGLAALVALPAASADPGEVTRPFRAAFAGTARWEWPGTHPAGCALVTTVTEATGVATHLGRTVLSSSHCPAEPEDLLDGHLVLVGAHGDELFGRYDYDPFDEGNTMQLAFVGGTGRFTNASGEAVWTYEVIPELVDGCEDPTNFDCLDFSVPWQWSSTMNGWVSY